MTSPRHDRSDIAILGAGNIGQALATGWVSAGIRDPGEIVLTRRDVGRLEGLAEEGFRITSDNRAAVRAVRAASQGGIEIGFHPDEALRLAAQTARGAASLLGEEGTHPESELDRVTTPRGCTIAGLNEMEHQGFSSALIKGIVVSAEKADELYEEG